MGGGTTNTHWWIWLKIIFQNRDVKHSLFCLFLCVNECCADSFFHVPIKYAQQNSCIAKLFLFAAWYDTFHLLALSKGTEWMKYNIWQDCKNGMACSSSSMSARICVQCSYSPFIAWVLYNRITCFKRFRINRLLYYRVRMKWNWRLTHFDMSTIQFLICADR